MTNSYSSKQSLAATCSALVTGLAALASANTVVSAGKTYTRAELLAPLQQYLVSLPVTAAAKTTYTKAVATEAEAKLAALAMIKDVITPFLQMILGKSSPDLETYGLQPTKAPETTVAVKAAAVQKGQVPRKALGTKGTAQKKAAKKALAAPPVSPAPAKS